MSKVPELAPLGANVSANDYVLVVQGGVTKRITAQNLFKAVGSLGTGGSTGDSGMFLMRSGQAMKVSHSALSNVYRDTFGIGTEWTVGTMVLSADFAAGNRAEISNIPGGIGLNNAPPFVRAAGTVDMPFRLRFTPPTNQLGYYSTTNLAPAWGSYAVFAGVNIEFPWTNSYFALAANLNGIEFPPQTLANGGCQLFAVPSWGPNWWLAIHNGTTTAGITRSAVLDTGIAVTSGYQSVGIIWDPKVGLHFVRNGQHMASLLPTFPAEYGGYGANRRFYVGFGGQSGAPGSYIECSHVTVAYAGPLSQTFGASDLNDLTPGADLDGSTSGEYWVSPFSTSDFGLSLGDDSLDTYTPGEGLDGKSGGTGWPSGFSEIPIGVGASQGFDDLDSYPLAETLGGKSGGTEWVGNWSEITHI